MGSHKDNALFEWMDKHRSSLQVAYFNYVKNVIKRAELKQTKYIEVDSDFDFYSNVFNSFFSRREARINQLKAEQAERHRKLREKLEGIRGSC